MDTKELIHKVKKGDDKSFELLLDAHHNMIYKIIYSLDLNKGDYMVDIDSLYQEGSIALYKAVFTFEEKNEMSFTSYAYMVIRARLHTYLRDTYRYLDNECVSIDNTNNVEFDIMLKKTCVSEDPLKYHREKEFEEHLNKFMNKLSKQDQEIFKLRSEDYTYKQISERLNINTKKIDNRLRVLRERLKNYLHEK